MKCRLCNSNLIKFIYNGKIRSGSYGNLTKEKFKIYECSVCKVQFLHPTPLIDYSKNNYRKDYNKSVRISEYFSLHDNLQIKYLEIFKNIQFRNKVICDIGSGGGSFLDFVKGLSKKTIAVEPFKNYHQSLTERDHEVFSDLFELKKKHGKDSIDLITSFHVIEHISDPIEFLSDIKYLLKKNGQAIIITPNSSDILIKLNIPEYKQFFYRTVHQWYFNKSSLEYLTKSSSIDLYKIKYQHNYNLSNYSNWLNKKVPSGNNGINLFTNNIESAWTTFLEESGYADSIILYLIK